jgi:hypothetical protein
MACSLFEERHCDRCGAVTGTLIPSHHERERYCRTNNYTRCPTYQLYRLRGKPLSEETYFDLWLAPSPEPRPM